MIRNEGIKSRREGDSSVGFGSSGAKTAGGNPWIESGAPARGLDKHSSVVGGKDTVPSKDDRDHLSVTTKTPLPEVRGRDTR